MKRVRLRLSTLLLWVVIAGLGLALATAARREAELKARLTKSWPLYLKRQEAENLRRRIGYRMHARYLAERRKAMQKGMDASPGLHDEQ